MNHRNVAGYLLVAIALGAACSSKVTGQTKSGVKYEIIKSGEGAEVKHGDLVAVHYTGWLENGTKFDSSKDRGQPFVFPVGQGRVIKGWEEGVVGMKKGEIRRLTIPPELAYGQTGAGNVIPPNATLLFEVELIEFRSLGAR